MTDVGVVTIGRNEGERLRLGLSVLRGLGVPVVYADSRSTDGSPELARAFGADVVVLDDSRPVSMSRGRNEGLARLLVLHPGICYVQFVDGDCELREGWLESGRAVLEERADVALVIGRIRERFPERSIYNRLANLDWDQPVGEIKGSHGLFMIRVDAFQQVGGFDESIVASEDHELSLRLRRQGWKLLRIDREMALHDMDMTRFSQWWRRATRTGYGFADGAYLHGRSPDRWCVREVRSILCWGFLLPLLIILSAWPTRGLSLVLALAYPLNYWRNLWLAKGRGWSSRDARSFAFWCILSVFPMFLGLVTYSYRLLARQPRRIIEYKSTRASRARTDLNSGSAGD